MVSFHLLLFQCGPAGTRLGLHLNRASQGNRAQCAAGDNWTLDNKFGTIGPVNKLIFQAKDPNVLVDRGAVTGTFNPFITVNVKVFNLLDDRWWRGNNLPERPRCGRRSPLESKLGVQLP